MAKTGRSIARRCEKSELCRKTLAHKQCGEEAPFVQLVHAPWSLDVAFWRGFKDPDKGAVDARGIVLCRRHYRNVCN